VIFRIAIVGAGPAGYFTAQALQRAQNKDTTFLIDMIERLPTPWGLVRSGVAPDHLKIKSVSKVFEKIAKEDGFRLFANVELGKDVSLRDLREAYDVVVLAIGSSVGRKLGIAGEDLPNCFSAADFVPWYNAHPDFANLNVELNTDTAIVIGAGNVALDVARMLAVSPSELGSTDIAEHALSVLKSSNIRNIIICGRRGPEHATFTAPEFRELSKLKSTDIYINEVEISEAYARVKQVFNADKDLKNNLETMQLLAKERRNNSDRKLEIKFLLSPLEIKGSDKVEEVVFSINSVEDGKVFTTDRKISIKAGLVVSAIGYETADYSEIKIQNGRIANIAGHVEHNVYVTGWAKRGPIGVIGTNKSDSADVVELIIKNLKEPKNSSGIEVLLKPGHIIINQVGWEKINASEVISGALAGKPRVKEADWKRLISLGGAHEITKI
jgi:ferredoxin--NADP+ reductase